MKPYLHCYSSPQYRDMAETMKRSAEPDFDVCILGRFGAPACNGQGCAMLQGYMEKMQGILRAIKLQRRFHHEVMIWSDADCYFIRPCAEDVMAMMRGADAVFSMNGTGHFSTGFFACRTTDKMLYFWTTISKDPKYWKPREWTGFEENAAWDRREEINFRILHPDEYWSPCIPLKGNPDPKWQPTELPSAIRMIHLSCIEGHNKRAMMQRVIELARGMA